MALKLLYYAPVSYGALAEYTHLQLNAMVSLGADIVVLSTPKYQPHGDRKYRVVPALIEAIPLKRVRFRSFRIILNSFILLQNISILRRFIKNDGYLHVFIQSFAEYLSPLWAPRLKQLADRGVIFGATIHDPVRNYVVGPVWWHRLSVACAYSFLTHAFVHEACELETFGPQRQFRITVIPHPAFEHTAVVRSRAKTRQDLCVPDNASVLLSFGFIRDNKSLDCAVRALQSLPGVYLIVAGAEQSDNHKPVSFYKMLAEELGVSDRCRWINRYIPEVESSELFEASDVVLLAYDKTFVSASGVLALAAAHRKACLASSGGGSLQSLVTKYGLGVWMDSCDSAHIVEGYRVLTQKPLAPAWDRFHDENSWALNAKQILQTFDQEADSAHVKNT